MPVPDPTAAGVYWHNGKRWIAYDPKTAQKIREAVENVEKQVQIGPFGSGWHFTVDLRTMTQTNVESGMENRVKVIESRKAEPERQGVFPEDLARRRWKGHCRICPLRGALHKLLA